MRLLFLFVSLTCSVAISAQTQTVGLFVKNNTWDGYTLISPMGSLDVHLIDNCGERVHTWNCDGKPGLMSYIDQEGNLIRAERISSEFTSSAGGSGGRISKYSWDGTLIWSYDVSDSFELQHHDIAVLESGNILVLAWDRYTEQQAIAAGRNPEHVEDYIWSEKIIELRPKGSNEAEVVWEWKFWDHLIQDLYPSKANFGSISQHPEKLNINFSGSQAQLLSGGKDWLHCNSIDYNAELDQIVINSRSLDEFYIIDHSTTTEEAAGSTGGLSGKGGDILYRWGNPQSYQLALAEQRQLYKQHNARWAKYGDDQEWAITVFNNGLDRPGEDYSQVDIIKLPIAEDLSYYRAPSTPFGPLQPAWTLDTLSNAQDPTFFSTNVSGAQLLPNGNVIVCVGGSGKIFEVDSLTKSLQWLYVSPAENSSSVPQGIIPSMNQLFRAPRYAIDYVGFEGKDVSPKGPLELEPLTTFCDPSPAIDLELGQARIFPNPTTGSITIEGWPIGREIQVYDLMGSLQFEQELESHRKLDISQLSNGIYMVQIAGAEAQRIVLLR